MLGLLALAACGRAAPTPTPTPTPMPTPTPSAGVTPTPTVSVVPTPTPEAPDTELTRWLGMVPLAYAHGDWDVWYGDRRYFQQLQPPGRVNGGPAYEEAVQQVAAQLAGRYGEEGAQLFQGIPEPRGLRTSNFAITQLRVMGWEKYQDIAVQQRKSPFPELLVARWHLDPAEFAATLQGFGYLRDSYEGVDYWRILEDREANFNVIITWHTFGGMNRVALHDGLLVTAPATAVLHQALDSLAGRIPSLLEDPSFRGLALALEEVQAAVFFPPPDGDTWKLPKEGWERLLEMYGSWGTLHPYRRAALGYATDGRQGEVRLALYYDEPRWAAEDAAEVVRRWDTYNLSFMGSPGVPLERVCSPLRPQVRLAPRGSVLVGRCTVDLSAFERDSYDGPPEVAQLQRLGDLGRAASVWYRMVEVRDVYFLAPDLRALATR